MRVLQLWQAMIIAIHQCFIILTQVKSVTSVWNKIPCFTYSLLSHLWIKYLTCGHWKVKGLLHLWEKLDSHGSIIESTWKKKLLKQGKTCVPIGKHKCYNLFYPYLSPAHSFSKTIHFQIELQFPVNMPKGVSWNVPHEANFWNSEGIGKSAARLPSMAHNYQAYQSLHPLESDQVLKKKKKVQNKQHSKIQISSHKLAYFCGQWSHKGPHCLWDRAAQMKLKVSGISLLFQGSQEMTPFSCFPLLLQLLLTFNCSGSAALLHLSGAKNKAQQVPLILCLANQEASPSPETPRPPINRAKDASILKANILRMLEMKGTGTHLCM